MLYHIMELYVATTTASLPSDSDYVCTLPGIRRWILLGINTARYSLNIHTLQSSYNFTNSRVATHFHAWLHAKSCCVPRLVAACPTPCPRMVTRKELPCATLSSCVSHAMSTRGYTQKAAVCHA